MYKNICSHIYSGELTIGSSNESLVDILIASDELELLEIYQQLEKHLLKNYESVLKLPKDFITLFKFHQDDRFANLYENAIELVCKNAKFIFNSEEFVEIKEQQLIQLLKRDDLKLEEIEIWDYLIKWGIKNTESILDENSTNWTPMNFIELEKTLHDCILHIRFSQMSPKVFKYKVRKQYKNILPEDLVEDVLQYFSDPDSKPLLKNLPLRVTAYSLDSQLINAHDAATIATWIDKKKGIPYHFKEIPFKFELIYRASQNGFDKFHEYCDNKGPTVVITKVPNSREIFGGYNPLDWRSVKSGESMYCDRYYCNHKCKTSNSFIFSLNGVTHLLSRVTSKKDAIIWCKDKGPCFGLRDLWVHSNSRSGESKQGSYKTKIIDSETFEIEEYEVFQIIDKRFFTWTAVKKICNFTWTAVKKICNFTWIVVKEICNFTWIVVKEICSFIWIIVKFTFQLVGTIFQFIIDFLSSIDKETYAILFTFLCILSVLALLVFIIYKLLESLLSFLFLSYEKILSVFYIPSFFHQRLIFPDLIDLYHRIIHIFREWISEKLTFMELLQK
jgi:hypothetical protein